MISLSHKESTAVKHKRKQTNKRTNKTKEANVKLPASFTVNPLTSPVVILWVQLWCILRQTGLSRHL